MNNLSTSAGRISRRDLLIGAASAGVLTAHAGVTGAPSAVAAEQSTQVGGDRLDGHLRAFDAIASRNGGNRATMTEGYEQSARYIENALASTSLATWRQEFDYTVSVSVRNTFTIVAPEPCTVTTYLVRGVSMSPVGGSDGRLVSPADETGDSPDSWAAHDVSGAVAILRIDPAEGSEELLPAVRRRLQYAAEAGIVAVVLHLHEEYTPIEFTEADDERLLPAASIPSSEATMLRELLALGDVVVHADFERRRERRRSFNLIAGTPGASPTHLFGAHLDSVPEGPGINDNAAGAAALLEAALRREGEANPNVRFAWWGAHEDGINGSAHYVEQIVGTPELAALTAYVNLEIVGSSNSVVSVFVDGAGTERIITDHFTAIGQPWLVFPPGAQVGSDHVPFRGVGVPHVVLSSYYVSGVKTEEESALFGGIAGAPYNPNYHNEHDDYSNINLDVVEIMTLAVRNAIDSVS